MSESAKAFLAFEKWKGDGFVGEVPEKTDVGKSVGELLTLLLMPRNAQRSYRVFDGSEVISVTIFKSIADAKKLAVRFGKTKNIEVIHPLECRGDFVVLPYVYGGVRDLSLETRSRGETKWNILVNVEEVLEANHEEAFVIGFHGHGAIGAFYIKGSRLSARRG